jgi:chaperonin cofactor prefoldin
MTKHNQHKPMTLDDLAVMINQGFMETQKHIDQSIGKVEGVLKDVVEELHATHEDVRYVRNTVTMLVKSDAAQDAALKTLAVRVTRLENKVGLAH